MSEAVAVEVKERFVVDNDMKAEWCLSKIRGIRAEQNRETEELQRQMQFYLDQMEMIKAKADEGWKFVKWTKDGTDFSEEPEITVEVSEDVEYIAVFETE